MQVQVVERVLGDVTDTKGRVLLDLSLLRQGLSLERERGVKTMSATPVDRMVDAHGARAGLTVNSLIRVDFPAPLGPRIPTRLLNDNAHETSIKLGLAAPS